MVTVELTDEQLDTIQDLYVKCNSCWGYDEWPEPREWMYMCEDCIG